MRFRFYFGVALMTKYAYNYQVSTVYRVPCVAINSIITDTFIILSSIIAVRRCYIYNKSIKRVLALSQRLYSLISNDDTRAHMLTYHNNKNLNNSDLHSHIWCLHSSAAASRPTPPTTAPSMTEFANTEEPKESKARAKSKPPVNEDRNQEICS